MRIDFAPPWQLMKWLSGDNSRVTFFIPVGGQDLIVLLPKMLSTLSTVDFDQTAAEMREERHVVLAGTALEGRRDLQQLDEMVRAPSPR